MRAGAFKSLASLVIKLAAAALTYLSYVVLSRTMSIDEYGYFAFGLSLATVLAIGAGMGQQTAILRTWPEHMVARRHEDAMGSISAGAALTLGAGVVLSAVLILGEVLLVQVGGIRTPINHIYAAALLILPLALAEFHSSALRAQGSVWNALAPRDVLWRILLPAAVLLLFFGGIRLTGQQALILASLLLLLILALQYGLAVRRGYSLTPHLRGVKRYWAERGTMSTWLLFGTIIESAALNFDIVLVGLMVGPESSAIYFNSARTAGLMTLLQFAMSLVIAPMVARHMHAGEHRKAQAVAAMFAWAGFSFALLSFGAFLLVGGQLLALFGASYAEGQLVLMILSVGFLFEAATGPSRTIMVMSGQERAYARLFAVVLLAGTLAQIVAIPMFGIVGAACATMATRIVSQIAFVWWCRTRIGLDSTLLGVLALRGARSAVTPVPARA